jgi:ADP-ribose pyrophosphatase YjhB (NUDIX family)
MPFPPMNFCSNCGSKLSRRVPAGDSLPRYVCDACGTIHYQNPLIVVGTIPVWEDRILLCKRAIEPRYGLWTLPAGFMELGETTSQAALRETREEAKAEVELGDAFTLLSVPHVDQVHLFYRARLREPNFGAGEETLEVGLFGRKDIPWNAIAFRTVATTLKYFFDDREAGSFRLHPGEILPAK